MAENMQENTPSYMQKALERLMKEPEELKAKQDEHNKSKEFLVSLLKNMGGNKTPNFLGGTGINKGGVDTGYGRILNKAPFATQAEADLDLQQQLKQQEIDRINREASARQLGDTQNISTETLGSGLVKQNIENVPGRESVYMATHPELAPAKSGSLTFEQRKELKGIGQERVLSDIPILTYDPLHPEAGMKQISTFKGRQGSAPRIIPTNNVMTDTAQQVVASQEISMGNLENMKNIMKSANIGDFGVYIAQAINNNTLFNLMVNGAAKTGAIDENTLDALLNFKAEFDAAKQNIAVARGGKQLTDTEIQLITNTLPRAFQNPQIWDEIINRYKNEYNTFRQSMKEGKKSVEPFKNATEEKKSETKTSNLSKSGFSDFLKNKKK